MLATLNEQQLAAVKCVDGPVIVFAGAGTGKTRTLTNRIIYMLKEKEIKASNILAITFTNKATNEMKNRLSSEIGIYCKGLTISTFHSLCVKILRIEIEKLGYRKDFDILDEEDQLKVISDILKANKEERKQSKKLQHAINSCKCFDILPKDPFIKKYFDLYEIEMRSLNALDFEDLLLKVYELFSTFPEVLEKYQRKFQYILVDEFQDTNLVQYKIVRSLAVKHHNLFVVGDDDQSIYSFRGTNYENMQLFKKDFPEFQMFHLTENYRSNQQILKGANRLINHNKDREQKELFSKNEGKSSDVVIYNAYDEKDEVNYVVDHILELKTTENLFTDFAVLYRSSVLLRNFEIGFIKAGIPYKVYGGVSYLKRREIKDCIAYLKLIINEDDIISFKRIINVPARGIGPTTVEKLENIRKEYKLTVFETIDVAKQILPRSKYQVLLDFKENILSLRKMMEDTNLVIFFDEMIDKIQYKQFIYNEYEKEEADDRIANLTEFKSILYQVENSDSDLSRISRLREAFDNAILSDEYLQNQKENVNGVTISTVHSVKGLEFGYVFLVGMEENLFPNNFKISNDSELEEERRIAYVACTRAKHKLFLTTTKRRMLYGSFFTNTPSRFMREFIGASIENEQFDDEATFKNDTPQKKNDELKDENYTVGMKIRHDMFGPGIIIDIDGDIALIFFDREKELKKIKVNAKALNKA